MEDIRYPDELKNILLGMKLKEDDIGKSTSKVLRYYDDQKAYYLKIQANAEIIREAQILDWLKGKLPVPEIMYYDFYEGYGYLLLAEIEGQILSSSYYLNRPEEPVKLLADGIKILQSISIDNCSFDARLDRKLEIALNNIKNNLVDIADWEEDNKFSSPVELFIYLKNNRPKNQTLSFTHGDYTLANILGKGSRISGFIDWGRGGVADIYQDIALAVRSLKHKFNTDKYIDLFFKYLDTEPDWERINYYILLDELF